MKEFVQKHFMLTLFCAVLVFCALVFATHYAMQQPKIYNLLGGVVKTYDVKYTKQGKEINKTSQPYQTIQSDKLRVWDAYHYWVIKQYLYTGGPEDMFLLSFAFFPLFPILWRLTGLNEIGISLMNWLLFALGLMLIYKIFKDKVPKWSFLLIFCVPFLVPFMIPYTEGLFFILIAIGLYGIIKDNYALYFVGFLLASMTKSSANIFIVAFFFVELIKALRVGTIRTLIVGFCKRILPILLGVLLVLCFQKYRGAPSFIQFSLSQQYYGRVIAFPHLPFTDWSYEGKSITWPMTYMFFIPMIVVLVREFFLSFKVKRSENFTTYAYVRLLSILFLVGSILFVMLTSDNKLNSLARYMLCTPFFFYLLFDTITYERKKIYNILYLLIGVATIILCLNLFSPFDSFGIYILMPATAIVFFYRYLNRKLLYTLIGILIFMNIFWTAYMFNAFICDGWIFT